MTAPRKPATEAAILTTRMPHLRAMLMNTAPASDHSRSAEVAGETSSHPGSEARPDTHPPLSGRAATAGITGALAAAADRRMQGEAWRAAVMAEMTAQEYRHRIAQGGIPETITCDLCGADDPALVTPLCSLCADCAGAACRYDDRRHHRLLARAVWSGLIILALALASFTL